MVALIGVVEILQVIPVSVGFEEQSQVNLMCMLIYTKIYNAVQIPVTAFLKNA